MIFGVSLQANFSVSLFITGIQEIPIVQLLLNEAFSNLPNLTNGKSES
jgi:hypothetical protein